MSEISSIEKLLFDLLDSARGLGTDVRAIYCSTSAEYRAAEHLASRGMLVEMSRPEIGRRWRVVQKFAPSGAVQVVVV